jgi:hypothetical protein
MAGKDGGAELPQRVPGVARTGPVPQVMSEELRQRMQAAVEAERAEEAAHEQERAAEHRTIEPPQGPPSSAASEEAVTEMTSSSSNGPSGKRTGASAAEPAATPERITGFVPEDYVTKWPSSAVKARAAAEAKPAVQPEPGKRRRRTGIRLAVPGLALIVIVSLALIAVRQAPSRRRLSARRLPRGSPGRSARMSPSRVTL